MSHDAAERAYVQSMVDLADARRDAVLAGMQTDINRLRDSWSSGYAEQRQAAEARIEAIREGTRAWVQGLYADGEDTPTDVAAGGREDGASVLTHTSVGHNGLRQRPTPDPREAELAEAARIRSLSWAEYAAERNQHGITSISAHGLFG
jgi:hypothetical protein